MDSSHTPLDVSLEADAGFATSLRRQIRRHGPVVAQPS